MDLGEDDVSLLEFAVRECKKCVRSGVVAVLLPWCCCCAAALVLFLSRFSRAAPAQLFCNIMPLSFFVTLFTCSHQLFCNTIHMYVNEHLGPHPSAPMVVDTYLLLIQSLLQYTPQP